MNEKMNEKMTQKTALKMREKNRHKLWEEYSKNQTRELNEKLILEYANLVKIVAGRLSMYLGQNVEYDDLVGYGIFGLIDAIDKFDYSKGIKFETYASLRIRGSILDQIRKMDWIPRTVRQKQKKIDTAIQELEVRFGRAANDEELAEELEISKTELEVWQSQTSVTNIASLDEYLDQGLEGKVKDNYKENNINPEVILNRKETKEILLETLEHLTKNEKTVIILYYYEELTLKEISKVLEVSESRISQLHSKALRKMKDKLGKNFGILTSY